jgi:phospholipase C
VTPAIEHVFVLMPPSFELSGTHYSYWLDGHFVYYDQFARQVGSADYAPRYTFIEPSYGNWIPAVTSGDYSCGTSQHPQDDVTRGEWLIKCTYEAIRNSPLWETSLLLVTWDEHGGFYDHVAPPTAPTPGDGSATSPLNRSGFDFTRLGVRVPAVVVSPYVTAFGGGR